MIIFIFILLIISGFLSASETSFFNLKKHEKVNKEVKKFTSDEIKNKIHSLKKDLFNFRFRKVNGQLVDTAKVSQVRKDIARLFTKLNLKK